MAPPPIIIDRGERSGGEAHNLDGNNILGMPAGEPHTPSFRMKTLAPISPTPLSAKTPTFTPKYISRGRGGSLSRDEQPSSLPSGRLIGDSGLDSMRESSRQIEPSSTITRREQWISEEKESTTDENDEWSAALRNENLARVPRSTPAEGPATVARGEAVVRAVLTHEPPSSEWKESPSSSGEEIANRKREDGDAAAAHAAPTLKPPSPEWKKGRSSSGEAIADPKREGCDGAENSTQRRLAKWQQQLERKEHQLQQWQKTIQEKERDLTATTNSLVGTRGNTPPIWRQIFGSAATVPIKIDDANHEVSCDPCDLKIASLVFDPTTSWVCGLLAGLTILFAAIAAVEAPLIVAFDDSCHGDGDVRGVATPRGVWRAACITADITFALQVFAGPFRGFIDGATMLLVRDVRRTAPRYATGWFIPDLLAAAPLVMLDRDNDANETGIDSGRHCGQSIWLLLRMVRVCALFKNAQMFKALDRVSSTPAIRRLLRTFALFALSVHVFACAYWRIAIRGSSSESSVLWRTPVDMENNAFSLEARWLHAVHVVLLLVTGGNTEPDSLPEQRFSCFAMIVGIIGLSVLIGLATVTATDFDVIGRKKAEQIDSVLLYLQYRRVPPDVRDQIVSFIEYLWSSGQAAPETEALEGLPDSLKLKLDMALKQQLIRRVPLFKGLPQSGVVAIVRQLNSLVAIPGEVIVHEGHVGHEMFFLGSGSVRVYKRRTSLAEPTTPCTPHSPHTPSVGTPNSPIAGESDENGTITDQAAESTITGTYELARLHAGSFFGEMALINPARREREASIEAMTFCDLFMLEMNDFQEIACQYEQIFTQISQQATHRRSFNDLNVRKLSAMRLEEPSSGRFATTSMAHMMRHQSIKRFRRRKSEAIEPEATTESDALPTSRSAGSNATSIGHVQHAPLLEEKQNQRT